MKSNELYAQELLALLSSDSPAGNALRAAVKERLETEKETALSRKKDKSQRASWFTIKIRWGWPRSHSRYIRTGYVYSFGSILTILLASLFLLRTYSSNQNTNSIQTTILDGNTTFATTLEVSNLPKQVLADTHMAKTYRIQARNSYHVKSISSLNAGTVAPLQMSLRHYAYRVRRFPSSMRIQKIVRAEQHSVRSIKTDRQSAKIPPSFENSKSKYLVSSGYVTTINTIANLDSYNDVHNGWQQQYPETDMPSHLGVECSTEISSGDEYPQESTDQDMTLDESIRIADNLTSTSIGGTSIESNWADSVEISNQRSCVFNTEDSYSSYYFSETEISIRDVNDQTQIASIGMVSTEAFVVHAYRLQEIPCSIPEPPIRGMLLFVVVFLGILHLRYSYRQYNSSGNFIGDYFRLRWQSKCLGLNRRICNKNTVKSSEEFA